MGRSAYYARLTRPENARCEAHEHGYGGAFGTSCRDCNQAQREALSYLREQLRAVEAEPQAAFEVAQKERLYRHGQPWVAVHHADSVSA